MRVIYIPLDTIDKVTIERAALSEEHGQVW